MRSKIEVSIWNFELWWALARCLTYNTVFWKFSKISILWSFLFIQNKKDVFWNFGGQNHEISKIRDSHLVELVILRLSCAFYAFLFNSLPFMDSQTIATFGSKIACSDVTKTLIAPKFRLVFLKFCQKMVHLICDSYPKFGAAAPRQTGVITRRKKWGRLTPPPANAGLNQGSAGASGSPPLRRSRARRTGSAASLGSWLRCEP